MEEIEAVHGVAGANLTKAKKSLVKLI